MEPLREHAVRALHQLCQSSFLMFHAAESAVGRLSPHAYVQITLNKHHTRHVIANLSTLGAGSTDTAAFEPKRPGNTPVSQ